MARGGAQIQGASGAAVRRILEEFGETRPFAGEGGRTNRGSPRIAADLLDAIREADIADVNAEERVHVLTAMQSFLVEKVREFHNRERLKPIWDPATRTRSFVNQILTLAKETEKYGPVAQYLVGAKLQLRFPEIDVRNESYSAADRQGGQPGDFLIGDTAFHVTVAPTLGHFEKCVRNLREGRRTYFLVPEDVVQGTRQSADLHAAGQIAVESIESFVSQNIDELSTFGRDALAAELRLLVETYNRRVDAVEIDKSMMIELPPNLSNE
jgi:hypothetical protein